LTTDTTTAALAAARRLAEAGVPLFLAPPAPSKIGFSLPKGWERTEADPTVVDRWKPGWALCAVMGHVIDTVDIDPRNGGSLEALAEAVNGPMPQVYGIADTPSGGQHHIVATLGVRKVQDLVPGVDLQAGNPEGMGRGFIFLAPTVRESKADGERRAYRWAVEPDLGALLLDADDTGGNLLHLVHEREGDRPGADGTLEEYDGPTYNDLDEGKQKEAREHVNGELERWLKRFEEARGWAEGEREDGPRSRGWEGLTYQFAWALAKMAACPWTDLTEEDAHLSFTSILPPEMAEAVPGKWYDGIALAAASEPVDVPPWVVRGDPGDDFSRTPAAWPEIPTRFHDAYMCAWMAHKGLGGDWCWAAGFGWLFWDGKRWDRRPEEDVTEGVRRAILRVSSSVIATGDADLIKAVTGLLQRARIGAITSLMRGVVSVPAGSFDQRNDLLNCGNGVVNLRTGELLPHDREYLMMKLTRTAYVPGAQHDDWDTCLSSLDSEVADWMQVRFGQAATGWPTSDDVLPVGVGGGSNGKSTLLAGLFTALGEYMVLVPDKLLRASPNDHPTELMSVFGARVAVIEETPEVGHLNVQRLKAVLGTERMTARSMHKDNVSWVPTHSLFLMSNYTPQIRETDHGTWRRLALVRFSKTFPKKDSFRANMTRGLGGRREAALAWVVAGAVRWYLAGGAIPPAPERVVADTRAWRGDTDLVLAFFDEGHIEFDPRYSILTAELLTIFNAWLVGRGQSPWASNTFGSRFGGHERFKQLEQVQTRDLSGLSNHPEYVQEPPKRPWVWRGIRWAEDEETAGQNTDE
jgi:putative DNA primase/helicase